MKYILFILALALVVNANAQSDMQHTPGGAAYKVYTNSTGEKVKLNDVITFDFVQKTDKDSVLMSSYTTGTKAQVQVVDPKTVNDAVALNLMQLFPLLAVNDSAVVKISADSIFKGHEAQRPAFFPKGSNLNFCVKIERVQSLTDAMAERDAAMAKAKADEAAALAKNKAAEDVNVAKYITCHKLILKTTASGLKYAITLPSKKLRAQKGDTLMVNYAGRTLDDKVFDSSIESVAKASGLNQPGRTYEPIEVVVGEGHVIPGWDEGLQLLNEGTKATFVIPSALAYGSQSPGPGIPAFSPLVFDVEVVKIRPTKHAVVVAPPAAKKPMPKKKKTIKKS